MSDRMTDLHSLLRASSFALALAAAAGFTSACTRTNPSTDTSVADEGSERPSKAERHEIDLFAFGRQLGTIAPCGCTTDPLGGLQFAFGYIEAESSPGQRLVLEPGSFLFPDPDGPEAATDEAAWIQAQQRAALLQGRFSAIDGLVSGLGPTDFSSPAAGAALGELPMPRVVANFDAAARPAGVEPLRTISLGRGLTAAVTQVIDPQLAAAARGREWGASFPEVNDPLEAVRGLGAEFDQANLKVVMVHGPRSLAETLARELEIDILVIGGVIDNPDLGRVGSAPVRVGRSWILEPGDRGQTMAHLRLSIAGKVSQGQLPGEWTLIPSPEQVQAELDRVVAKLDKFKADTSADPGFIARLEAERDELAAKLGNPAIPEQVEVAVRPAQTKVTCRLPGDTKAKQALDNYDAEVAKANLERFTGVETPKPEPGQAGYVGIEACADCHEEAVSLWKTTIHAGAYETLVRANKQYDLSCVGCHVTGFRKPGGSEVVENHNLQSVQCEQCHGPASLHIEDPSTDNIRLEANSRVCLDCHTPEHSDTFSYDAYLRDILGPGHGEQARSKLGPGPTGSELRAAGLEKAGGGCPKM